MVGLGVGEIDAGRTLQEMERRQDEINIVECQWN